MNPSHWFDTTDPKKAALDITDLAPSVQEQAINAWLEHFDGFVAQVAMSAQSSFGRRDAHHMIDDIAQLTRVAAWQLLQEFCENPEKAQKVRSLKAVIRLKTRNHIRDHIERQETNGVTNVRSKHRNARELENLGYEMAQELGRTPTRAEIIKEWNIRNEGRKDSRRQGRAVDVNDFDFHRNSPPPMGHEVSDVEYYDEPDYLLMPMESQSFRDEVAGFARQQDEQLGLAAAAWLEEAQVGLRTEYGVFCAVRLKAGYKSLAEARQAVDTIRQLSITVLREHYGIAGA